MTRLATGLRWGLTMLVAGGMLGMPGGARAPVAVAEERAPSSEAAVRAGLPAAPEPRAFGTSAVAHMIPAAAFRAVSSTTAYTAVGLDGGLACAGAACAFQAPVFLPAGASVHNLDVELCDEDSGAEVSASLVRVISPGFTPGPVTIANLVSMSSSVTGTPGCLRLAGPLPVPETIDNQANSYFLQVSSGATTATRFFSVRLNYALQVSPAPMTATFGDVPTTHPFFRHVEALAAAGITRGCGVAMFCPDAPLTRGQMAAFLAIALGLHFAP